ncbi:hypothetical protein SETIT_6G108100v2 [Setaria italica]|uniref:Uncharacterized protein n=2 Tax=Setaria TaxID=4554 RepID=A0A368RKC9_SETIT|nr:hypothetical protein SETIT_6G108100v2 [Setaria italica]TKW09675.1 hypothetical protein SEVIR_6G118500v2 [Setaria viridis]
MLKLMMMVVLSILKLVSLLLDIGIDINLGCKHKMRVTYWDISSRNYEEVTSDQNLLHAIDMYWEIRRLSLQVCVIKKDDFEFMHDTGREQSMPCELQGSTPTPANEISAPPPLEIASLGHQRDHWDTKEIHNMQKVQTAWTHGQNMQ